MKLATWNVNSLRARLPRVTAWLAANAPDVACLQETKVEDDAFPRAELEGLGYEIAFHGQRTYNGVAILSKVGPIEHVARGFDDGVEDPAARFLAATVAGVRVACVYVPNGQAPGSDKFRYKLEWYARLRRWLERHASPGEPWAICGDYNVAPEDRDVQFPDKWRDAIHCTADERAALANLRAWGVDDVFRRHVADGGHYSWWDYRQLAFPKNNGLRIDHVLATSALRSTAASIDRNERKGKEPSDHAPVVVELAV
jgi:exodeoxyribonuclease-3